MTYHLFHFRSLPQLLLLFLATVAAVNAMQATPFVETASVRVTEVPREQEIPGVIRPAVRATLAPKVMGVITELSVDLGREVERGEVLARISAPEIAAQVDQARIAERQAARDLRRETELLARQAATAESVRDLEDRVQLAQARLREAEILLSYTELNAPFGGVITRKMAEEGDLASPGQPLLEIERLGALQLAAHIPDSLAASLAPDREYAVKLEDRRYMATLSEISASADPRTRTVESRFTLPPDAPARSGSFARLLLPVETVRRLEIPREALVPFGQVERVFVVQDGVARLRLVRSGQSRNGYVEVQAGLAAGETVIVNPPAGLRSGTPVKTGVQR